MHPNTFFDELWSGEESNEVFVAMSFDNHYRQRYVDIYKPAIEEIRLNGEHMRANRVDETGHGDSIITGIPELHEQISSILEA